MNKCQISAVRVRRKKCVFYLVAAVVLLTGIYDRQLVSARSSINSGQACSSRGQIRDFKAQRFICLIKRRMALIKIVLQLLSRY